MLLACTCILCGEACYITLYFSEKGKMILLFDAIFTAIIAGIFLGFGIKVMCPSDKKKTEGISDLTIEIEEFQPENKIIRVENEKEGD